METASTEGVVDRFSLINVVMQESVGQSSRKTIFLGALFTPSAKVSHTVGNCAFVWHESFRRHEIKFMLCIITSYHVAGYR